MSLDIKSVDIKQVEANYQKLREHFLRDRTQHEIRISKWGETIAKVDKSILEGIDMPEVITFQALCPEAYAEYPNETVYNEQKAKANALIEAVNARANEYYEKAAETMKEYSRFSV